LQDGRAPGRLAASLVAWIYDAVSVAAGEGLTMNTLKTQLAELQHLKIATYGKDFLLTWEKTDEELRALTLVAECLYAMHKARRPFRVFETGLAVSIFRDKSTRTRFSFASAVNALGLGLSELD